MAPQCISHKDASVRDLACFPEQVDMAGVPRIFTHVNPFMAIQQMCALAKGWSHDRRSSNPRGHFGQFKGTLQGGFKCQRFMPGDGPT